ncbi:alpha-(1-_6)-mannopyranosyltransferase A [Rhodococcus sp. X156]|uniref:alpha-(1->6)-mannopyranosyltransferase A n=1 Tax=Rhodococcus sp. X156 TaxID=2499145 RepID=UPI001F4991C8|nr:alpha-(1->6)-mannopyranosyltransferase A [Rhodococcus sp. X156]
MYLGLVASLLILAGGLGAGSVRVRDPLLESVKLSWLRFGHGHDLSTAAIYVGVLAMFFAWMRIGRRVLRDELSPTALRGVLVLWMAPLLASPPLFSRDAYSYLAQGALLRDGFKPYEVGPVANPGVLLDNVSSVWTTTTAPYGPLFLLLSDLITRICGDSVVAGTILLRLVMLPGIGLLVWALPRLAAHLGGNHAVALWIALLNPLVLVNLVGGVHNEMLMVGLLAAGTVLVLNRRHVAGFAAVAVGMAIKATAGLALPFLVWVWMVHRREDALARGEQPAHPLRVFAVTAGAGVAIVVAVFLGPSVHPNLGLGWITALSGSGLIINWLSLPTAMAHIITLVFGWLLNFQLVAVLPYTRMLCALALVGIVVWLWWRSRHSAVAATRSLVLALVAVVILSPAALTWYYAWPLALGAALPWRPRPMALVVGLSVGLMLLFRPSGVTGMYNWLDVAAALGLGVLTGVSLLRPDPLRLRAHSPVHAPLPTQP